LKKSALFQTMYSGVLLALIITITFTKGQGYSYLFGIISGFLVGMYLMENFDKERYEVQCSSTSIIIYILFVFIGAIHLVYVYNTKCEYDDCFKFNFCLDTKA
jgi:phosphotransferase system  glucose/maltose/N-acetylglucosamine-specific IIC component